MNPYGFPEELCMRTLPFIALSGLEINRNATHRFIWEAFSKNPLPIKLNILPPNHHFPVVKPKKPSYDRFIPKGILKRKWMRKHLLEIPSVVAIVVDLNWDDPNWEANKQNCVHQVNAIIRNQLGGLGTKLALILFQRVIPVPTADTADVRSSERAAQLCSACDVPAKQLFVVPQDDHLQGYVLRLQTALLDLAKLYYAQEFKNVKSHGLQLSKATHRYLYVRHCFKMAFLSELKQDDRTARNLYDNAYTHIKEVRPTDTNLHELKLVAGFINYKMCSCMFRLNEPRDALTQFKNHLKLYKPWGGAQPLMFEHYAWLAMQYAAFADLFDEAIRQGLSAMQTEHPGIYYRQAALYTIERRRFVLETCMSVPPPAGDQPPLEAEEFVGQRGWRPGKLAAEPLDPEAERVGVAALQAREAKVNHTSVIIGYLGNAITQFKTYRCPRMRLQLLVQMAEEYHTATDYGMALTVLSHMLVEYRSEKWWNLLRVQLLLAVSSSYAAVRIQDFIMFSLDVLGPSLPLEDGVRTAIYDNVMAVLKAEIPSPSPDIPAHIAEQARSTWARLPDSPVTVNMGAIETCLSLVITFTESEYPVGEPITFQAHVTCHCPGPLPISKITIALTSDGFSEDVDSEQRDVIVGRHAVFDFKTSAMLEAGRKLNTGAITVTLAGIRPVVVQLLPPKTSTVIPREFKRLDRHADPIIIDPRSSAVIGSQKVAVTMEITHGGPALLGELFPVSISISNKDSLPLYHAVLDVKLNTPGDETSPDASTRLSDEKETSISPRNIKLQLETVAPQENASARIFLKGYSPGDRNLTFTLTYNTNDDVTTPGNMTSSVEAQTTVGVVKPFEISNECLTTKFEPAPNCYVHESFLLCTDVRVTSPCPITIHNSTLELGLLVANECQKPPSQLAGVTLEPGDTGRDIFPITLTEARTQPVAVGTYVLQWSRVDGSTINSSSITLPAVRCLPSVLSVSMSLPAHGRVRTPMTVEYKLYNRTTGLLQLDLHVDASDAFIVAGQSQAVLRLLPESERSLKYNLYPLLSGLLALPRIALSAPELSDQLASTLQRNLPSHVYVMPAEKNLPVAT